MRSLFLVCVVVALLSALGAVEAARPVTHAGSAVLRISDLRSLSKAQVYALQRITDIKQYKIDRWSESDLMVPASTRAEVEAYLAENQLAYTVMIADVGAKIAAEDARREARVQRLGADVTAYPRGAADFFSDYHSLADIVTFTSQLAKQYPELVTLSEIGSSYGGVPIHAFRVTSQKGSSPKPAIYLEGGIHAREWIAHATVTYILHALVTGYGNDTHITHLLDNLEYHIVPVVNVDGYLYTYSTDRMWRKTTKPNPGSNCIGTDPNRNWNNHWCLAGVGGSTDPCDESYCGSAPFSEACVVAVSNYAINNTNIIAFVDFHSYSQMWMTPYGYTSDLPANNKAQQAMSQQAVAALTAVSGTAYQEGPIYSTVYPAAGSSADWAYDNTTNVKYSFGVELRDTGSEGFLLDPTQIIPSGLETLAAVEAMGDYLLANPSEISEPKQFGNMKQYSRRPDIDVVADSEVQQQLKQLELEAATPIVQLRNRIHKPHPTLRA